MTRHIDLGTDQHKGSGPVLTQTNLAGAVERQGLEMRFLVLGAGALGGFFGGQTTEGWGRCYIPGQAPSSCAIAARLVVKTQDGEIRTPVCVIYLSCKAKRPRGLSSGDLIY